MNDDFTTSDYWKALILYGLNQATYKIALGKTLLTLAERRENTVSWESLSDEFLSQYTKRLEAASPMPQQAMPGRLTVMERIVSKLSLEQISHHEAVVEVGQEAFKDVILRFDNLAGLSEVKGKFYTFDFGKTITLSDDLFRITDGSTVDLEDELGARWDLLEGAFAIRAENFDLGNDERLTYLINGYERRDITGNIAFLQGYQGNLCFYCGGEITSGDIHVDHVLPRQVVQHDEIWNLVLAHSLCNAQKSDKIVGDHFMQKLIARNENIMGSNHPWKKKISEQLGADRASRASALRGHYDRVKTVRGGDYWGGSEGYNPATDRFYGRLITQINNR